MLLTTDQSSHTTLHECSLLLGTKKIKVENQLVGGGFGGKEDMVRSSTTPRSLPT